jgi:mRNA-degrading endonuclease RelE of RelBE toxin-antitoxin system
LCALPHFYEAGLRLSHYTSQGIVYSIVIHTAAKQDLAEIGLDDPDTENDIYALLQEVKGSQELLCALTIKDFGLTRDSDFHVDLWTAQQQKGRNLWRLKLWDLEDLGIRYRVIYAFDNRISRYFVLAVLHRDFNYDETHPRCKQLIEVYDRLGIPSYG